MPTTHRVKQGECLSSIAEDHGFPDWKTIYDDPGNAELREKRPNPNVLYPGDKVVIPDKKPKKEACATAQTHTFKVKRAPCMLRIVVKDENEAPIAGKAYELIVGGETREGTTGSDGLVEEAVVPHAERGHLTVWLTEDKEGARFRWELSIGHLDPIQEVEGVQARLNNLGFYCGEVDGEVGPRTRAALRTFQWAFELPITGELDDKTRQKIAEEHGKT
jgi:N-acetylmuramoyl-L-alanine amidase